MENWGKLGDLGGKCEGKIEVQGEREAGIWVNSGGIWGNSG